MPNPFSDNLHHISLKTAVEMTTRFRNQNSNHLPSAETFDRPAFDSLLAQSGCTAVRIYYGMDEALQVRLIVVGVNERNEDILPTDENSSGDIVEVGKLCPPFCAASSPLNA